MEIEAVLAIAMFLTAIAALLAGYPVALTLGGVALIFALIGASLDLFSFRRLGVFSQRIEGVMENEVLIAVPLFVLMGVVLERSRVAEDLLQIAGRLLRRVRGGLGYAVILVGALLAASTGIVGATVIAMSLIALPAMLHQGYNPRVASGVIAASGTLGQIIPPSIVLILLADAISNASQRSGPGAAGGSGVVSVGDLFAGALLPGLVLVGFYMAYIFAISQLRPGDTPRPPAELEEGDEPTAAEIVFGLGAPLLLILAVLGSILGGLASPTEASAIGASGAVLLAGLRLSGGGEERLRWAVFGGLAGLALVFILRLSQDPGGPPMIDRIGVAVPALAAAGLVLGLVAGAWILARTGRLNGALKSSGHITSMVFLILIGASLFALVFRVYRGDELVERLLMATPGGLWGALALTMIVMFVLGFFLDFIEIVYVVVPLVALPLVDLGADPVWLGVLMALNLQTSFLTPPFGFALFYLRGSAPDSLKTTDIWRGAIPFIGLQLTMIALVAAIPAIATWLPRLAAS